MARAHGLLFLISAAALVSVGIACGDDDASPPTSNGTDGGVDAVANDASPTSDGTVNADEDAGASVIVTPEAGGTVTVGNTVLTVPPGAVTQPTAITIKEIDPSTVGPLPVGHTAIGPMVALLPHGLTFAKDVTVKLLHTITATPPPSITVMRLDNEADTTWESIPSAAFANRITFATTTFSVVVPSLPTADLDAGSHACAPPLVISRVYVAGGIGAQYPNNDFVEIHNRDSNPITLTGRALQLNDATSTGSWTVVPLTGTLTGGGYYLVALGRDDMATGVALPTPDATGAYNLATSTGGRLAITADTTALTGAGPWTIMSGVAYAPTVGPTTVTVEGNPSTGVSPSPGSMLQRYGNGSAGPPIAGCNHSGDNKTDLAGFNYKTPNNTASPPVICGCVNDGG